VQRASFIGSQMLFLDNLHGSFDAFPPFHGKAAHCVHLLIFRASARGRAQEVHLLAKATTPATYEQMEPKTKSFRQRKRSDQRLGLQPCCLFTAWR
jgi:hypothetical protein